MTKKSKKIGRPTLPTARRRDQIIAFRATDELANRLQRIAERRGIDRSAVVLDQLSTGPIDESADLIRDLASAMRMIGEWKEAKAAEKNAEDLRTVAQLLVNAHLGGPIPTGDKLLEDKRYGSTRARMIAYTIISNTFGGRK